MSDLIKLYGQEVRPGTKQVIPIPVTTFLDGSLIHVWVHAVRGSKPGPTLTLLSSLHGDEYLSVEYVRRVVLEANPEEMSGSLLAIPVANPLAFAQDTRATPDESDGPDLNRIFPGNFNWIADQLVRAITDNVLSVTDYLMDFHLGGKTDVFADVVYGDDYPDTDIVRKSEAMAKAFGFTSLHVGNVCTSFPGPRSAIGYAGAELKIPSMIAEVGGTGFGLEYEKEWIDINVKGIRNVMKHVGILQGTPEVPSRYLKWRKRWRVNPNVGGYLHSRMDAKDLLKEVEAGEWLGTMISPYTFEEMERLEAPGRGVLFYLARSQPLIPGMWAFGVIDLEDPETQWIDA